MMKYMRHLKMYLFQKQKICGNSKICLNHSKSIIKVAKVVMIDILI